MTIGLPMACFLAALVIGACVEAIAFALRIWSYRSPWFVVINVVAVFGLIQGFGVGWLIGGRQAMRGVFPVLFMVGAVLGVLVEGVNQYWLRAWSWGRHPLLGVSRPIDKAAVVGVAWGFAPLCTVVLARLMTSASLDS